jgi:hypothetical protein
VRDVKHADQTGTGILCLAIGRSGRFLRTSTLLLALVAVATLAVLTYVERAYAQQRGDFEDNPNLRVISVKHREASGGPFGQLGSDDSGRISGLLGSVSGSRRRADRTIVVSNRYELGTAIETSDGRAVFVYGFDPDLAPALGLPALADGVGYTLRGGSGEFDLKISVVTVRQEGYSSGSMSPQHVAYRGVLKRNQMEYLLGGMPGEAMIVNTATFARIATAMYAMDWPLLQRSWERGELAMTPLIGGIAVYVPGIDGVHPAAQQLQRSGYSVDYGLRAFDNLSRSLRHSTIVAAGLVLLFLIGPGVYVLASWRAYLRLSRRDIGILKHWGIPSEWIRAGYSRRLLLGCLMVTGTCLVTALAAGAVAFGPAHGLGIGLVNWAFISCVLLATWKLGSRGIVGHQVGTGTLELLTREREFQ